MTWHGKQHIPRKGFQSFYLLKTNLKKESAWKEDFNSDFVEVVQSSGRA